MRGGRAGCTGGMRACAAADQVVQEGAGGLGAGGVHPEVAVLGGAAGGGRGGRALLGLRAQGGAGSGSWCRRRHGLLLQGCAGEGRPPGRAPAAERGGVGPHLVVLERALVSLGTAACQVERAVHGGARVLERHGDRRRGLRGGGRGGGARRCDRGVGGGKGGDRGNTSRATHPPSCAAAAQLLYDCGNGKRVRPRSEGHRGSLAGPAPGHRAWVSPVARGSRWSGRRWIRQAVRCSSRRRRSPGAQWLELARCGAGLGAWARGWLCSCASWA
jgi:hypothetical protein